MLVLGLEREELEGEGEPPQETEIEPLFERVRELLANPVQYWRSADLQGRQLLQELAFEQPLSYDPKLAYRTARLSPIFAIFEAAKRDKSSLVDLVRENLNPVAEQLRQWRRILDLGSEAA